MRTAQNEAKTAFFSPFYGKGWLCLLLIFCFIPGLFAQNNSLNRISTAERSDGKGYVVRFHMDEQVDSSRVYQPTTDLIQMTLYGENIDTTGIERVFTNEVYDHVSFYDLPFGIGVDFYINPDQYFRAETYPDGQSNDLLLGLTHTDKSDLEFLTDGLEPVMWTQYSVNEESLLVGGGTNGESPQIVDVSAPDETYTRVKDKLKFDVIVIDAGHGGHDPGSEGYKGIKEKNIVLQIAKKIGGYINEYIPDVKVVYTRDDDTYYDLHERGSIANKAEGDLFVSIHANKHFTRHAHGTETYFLGPARTDSALQIMQRENTIINPDDREEILEVSKDQLVIYELTNSGYMETSQKIAGMIEHQFDERAQRRSRGVKQAPFVVLYAASMPSILVETGFISNPSEARYLTSDYGQSIIASAIFRAIRNYKEQYEENQTFTTN